VIGLERRFCPQYFVLWRVQERSSWGSTRDRVKWGGYHAITSATEASKFTVENFIAGKSWLPATGIPFLLGLDD